MDGYDNCYICLHAIICLGMLGHLRDDLRRRSWAGNTTQYTTYGGREATDFKLMLSTPAAMPSDDSPT